MQSGSAARLRVHSRPMPFSEIRLEQRETALTVSPDRGAIVTGLSVDGREVLYLDRATFEDPTKNVRGGIPILFPFAGRLENDRFLPAHTTIPQHGFGRNRAWAVTGKDERKIVCALEPDAASRSVYPYEFRAEQSCRIIPRGVLVELRIRNRGDRPFPVAPGWHPYFRCPAARKPEIAGSVPGLTPDRFANETEFDFGLRAPIEGAATFQIPDLGTVALSWSPNLRHLQFWSPPGKDFVCIEPFTGPAGAIHTAEGRVEIPPGSAWLFWMRIELKKEA